MKPIRSILKTFAFAALTLATQGNTFAASCFDWWAYIDRCEGNTEAERSACRLPLIRAYIACVCAKENPKNLPAPVNCAEYPGGGYPSDVGANPIGSNVQENISSNVVTGLSEDSAVVGE